MRSEKANPRVVLNGFGEIPRPLLAPWDIERRNLALGFRGRRNLALGFRGSTHNDLCGLWCASVICVVLLHIVFVYTVATSFCN